MVILVLIELLMTMMMVKVFINNFPLGQDNEKDKRKNIIIVGNIMLNNINTRGCQSPRNCLSVTIQLPPVKIFLVL